MIKIMINNKVYIWSWRKFLRNLAILAAIIIFLTTIGIVGSMDYKIMTGV